MHKNYAMAFHSFVPTVLLIYIIPLPHLKTRPVGKKDTCSIVAEKSRAANNYLLKSILGGTQTADLTMLVCVKKTQWVHSPDPLSTAEICNVWRHCKIEKQLGHKVDCGNIALINLIIYFSQTCCAHTQMRDDISAVRYVDKCINMAAGPFEHHVTAS